MTALLEAVSGLEPQVMNYFSLRIAGSEEAQERVGVQILLQKPSYKLGIVLQLGVHIHTSLTGEVKSLFFM